MIEFTRLFLQGSNCSLSAVDFGNVQKPDMVVLHGTHDHALGMYPAIAELIGNYHIVGLDLRGHGHSDKPGNYSMLSMVADLRATITALGLRNPALVVHSLGGHIALRYAALYPDEVSALVILDGMGPPMFEGAQSAQTLVAGLHIGVEGALRTERTVRHMNTREEALARFTSTYPALDDECAALIVDNGIETLSDGGVRWRFDPTIDLIFHTSSDHEAEVMASLVTCPVLLITGDGALAFWRRVGVGGNLDEAAVAADQERRRTLFPNAQHALINAAGHMLHYDQPAAVRAELSNFLLS